MGRAYYELIWNDTVGCVAMQGLAEGVNRWLIMRAATKSQQLGFTDTHTHTQWEGGMEGGKEREREGGSNCYRFCLVVAV